MVQPTYSFLDVTILDEVREGFAAGDALVVLSSDLDEVVWANGPGARLLGYPDIGAALGKTPAQVAIAWILDHKEITSVIIGPDTPQHVDDTLGATGWQLPADARATLDELSAPHRPVKTA